MPEAPKAVLFDLGDTVLSEVAYDIKAGFGSVSEYLSPHVTLGSLEEATAGFQTATSEFKLLQWINENLMDRNSSVSADEVELQLWNNTVSLAPIEDVQLVLEFLVEKGVRMAAVSNAIFSSACMKYELDKHGFSSYFEFILSSADLGIRKPDIRIFQSALTSLDMSSKDVWFIGDKWDADIIGASSMQMTPVWFKDHFPEHDGSLDHLKLREWGEFEELWQRQHVL